MEQPTPTLCVAITGLIGPVSGVTQRTTANVVAVIGATNTAMSPKLVVKTSDMGGLADRDGRTFAHGRRSGSTIVVIYSLFEREISHSTM